MNWNLLWWMLLPLVVIVMARWRVKHPAGFRSTFGWIRKIRARYWLGCFILVAVFAGGFFAAGLFHKEQTPTPSSTLSSKLRAEAQQLENEASAALAKENPPSGSKSDDRLTSADKLSRKLREVEKAKDAVSDGSEAVADSSSGNTVTVFLKGEVSTRGTRDIYLLATLAAFAIGCGLSWLIKNTLLDMGIALITAIATSHFGMTWIMLGSDPREPEGGLLAWKIFAGAILFFFILGCSRAKTRST